MASTDEQELNFRAILDLDTKPASETPAARQAAKDGKNSGPAAKPVVVKKESTDADRRSVKITRHDHRRLKLLSFWLDREGIMESPGITELLDEALAHYFATCYTEAGDFINQNL